MRARPPEKTSDAAARELAATFDSVVSIRSSSERGRVSPNLGASGDEDYLGLVSAGRGAVVISVADRRSRDEYDELRAERIALEYSETSESLRSMHDACPEDIPPPLVIRRWCRENPAFAAMMADAKKVKAETMMEETIEISGRPDYNVAKNQMTARQTLAKAYDRDVFGETQTLLGDKNRPLMVGASATAGMSEADLVAIASRGRIAGPPPKTVVAPELLGVAEPGKPAA